jgi:hypothetical protein
MVISASSGQCWRSFSLHAAGTAQGSVTTLVGNHVFWPQRPSDFSLIAMESGLPRLHLCLVRPRCGSDLPVAGDQGKGLA